jgi:microcystin-dependent protein
MKGIRYKIVAILFTIAFVIVIIAYSPKSNTAFIPCPSGAIMAFGGTTAPGGYLLCDGSAISRATYAALFSVIGTTYGIGDGSTTFDLPDLRQRFPLGKAASGTGNTLGGTGGTIDHIHDITHTHQVDPPNTTSGTPSATVAATNLTGTAASTTHTHDVNISAFTSGAASTSTSGTGNPPYLVCNFIIKL